VGSSQRHPAGRCATKEAPVLRYVDSDTHADVADALRSHFQVTMVRTASHAVHAIRSLKPLFVVTDLVLGEGDGLAVCAAARGDANAIVLVTTSTVERVPAALRAGCDAIVLKPFAPNLLCARLGRLKRCAHVVRARSVVASAHRLDASSSLNQIGTNHIWPDLPCSHCGERGIVSFDYTTRRRTWCACLACERVWIAARCDER
jgi:CheY-like chemotaxis protein